MPWDGAYRADGHVDDSRQLEPILVASRTAYISEAHLRLRSAPIDPRLFQSSRLLEYFVPRQAALVCMQLILRREVESTTRMLLLTSCIRDVPSSRYRRKANCRIGCPWGLRCSSAYVRTASVIYSYDSLERDACPSFSAVVSHSHHRASV